MTNDLISRQVAIDDIRTMNPQDALLDIKWIEMWLKQLPSAESKRRKGKWMRGWRYRDIYRCNLCGVWQFNDSHFCPNCGADMREEDNGIRD